MDKYQGVDISWLGKMEAKVKSASKKIDKKGLKSKKRIKQKIYLTQLKGSIHR